jgi:oxygen-independent coproporphyrinogen-3 oxidase
LCAAPPVALYVHVPFCVSHCPYCDFVVYAGSAARGPRNRVDAFIGAVVTEIGLRADAADARFGPPGSPSRPPLASLYIGGGTPSLLGADRVARVVELAATRFGLAPDAEVSLEANPSPAERGDARAWRQAGVTRLSIGAQSLVDDEIRRLGRRHAAADVAAAVEDARAARIESISLDLLYDIPGQSVESWEGSLDTALGLAPDHLSLYALTLEDPDADGLTGPLGDHLPTSPGARRWRTAALAAQDGDRAAFMYEAAVERLAAGGWHGYEISNWARPGHESRHNLAYWRRLPYEAVGPGAHAFDGAERRWNAAHLVAYVAALQPADGSSPVLPPGGRESIAIDTARFEEIVLGLRLSAGIPWPAADEPAMARAMSWAVEAGLADADDGRIRLTTRGRLLSSELFARL